MADLVAKKDLQQLSTTTRRAGQKLANMELPSVPGRYTAPAPPKLDISGSLSKGIAQTKGLVARGVQAGIEASGGTAPSIGAYAAQQEAQAKPGGRDYTLYNLQGPGDLGGIIAQESVKQAPNLAVTTGSALGAGGTVYKALGLLKNIPGWRGKAAGIAGAGAGYLASTLLNTGEARMEQAERGIEPSQENAQEAILTGAVSGALDVVPQAIGLGLVSKTARNFLPKFARAKDVTDRGSRLRTATKAVGTAAGLTALEGVTEAAQKANVLEMIERIDPDKAPSRREYIEQVTTEGIIGALASGPYSGAAATIRAVRSRPPAVEEATVDEGEVTPIPPAPQLQGNEVRDFTEAELTDGAAEIENLLKLRDSKNTDEAVREEALEAFNEKFDDPTVAQRNKIITDYENLKNNQRLKESRAAKVNAPTTSVEEAAQTDLEIEDPTPLLINDDNVSALADMLVDGEASTFLDATYQSNNLEDKISVYSELGKALETNEDFQGLINGYRNFLENAYQEAPPDIETRVASFAKQLKDSVLVRAISRHEESQVTEEDIPASTSEVSTEQESIPTSESEAVVATEEALPPPKLSQEEQIEKGLASLQEAAERYQDTEDTLLEAAQEEDAQIQSGVSLYEDSLPEDSPVTREELELYFQENLDEETSTVNFDAVDEALALPEEQAIEAAETTAAAPVEPLTPPVLEGSTLAAEIDAAPVPPTVPPAPVLEAETGTPTAGLEVATEEVPVEPEPQYYTPELVGEEYQFNVPYRVSGIVGAKKTNKIKSSKAVLNALVTIVGGELNTLQEKEGKNGRVSLDQNSGLVSFDNKTDTWKINVADFRPAQLRELDRHLKAFTWLDKDNQKMPTNLPEFVAFVGAYEPRTTLNTLFSTAFDVDANTENFIEFEDIHDFAQEFNAAAALPDDVIRFDVDFFNKKVNDFTSNTYNVGLQRALGFLPSETLWVEIPNAKEVKANYDAWTRKQTEVEVTRVGIVEGEVLENSPEVKTTAVDKLTSREPVVTEAEVTELVPGINPAFQEWFANSDIIKPIPGRNGYSVQQLREIRKALIKGKSVILKQYHGSARFTGRELFPVELEELQQEGETLGETAYEELIRRGANNVSIQVGTAEPRVFLNFLNKDKIAKAIDAALLVDADNTYLSYDVDAKQQESYSFAFPSSGEGISEYETSTFLKNAVASEDYEIDGLYYFSDSPSAGSSYAFKPKDYYRILKGVINSKLRGVSSQKEKARLTKALEQLKGNQTFGETYAIAKENKLHNKVMELYLKTPGAGRSPIVYTEYVKFFPGELKVIESYQEYALQWAIKNNQSFETSNVFDPEVYRTILEEAVEEGYGGVLIGQVQDGGGKPSNVTIKFRNNNIKSVTHPAQVWQNAKFDASSAKTMESRTGPINSIYEGAYNRTQTINAYVQEFKAQFPQLAQFQIGVVESQSELPYYLQRKDLNVEAIYDPDNGRLLIIADHISNHKRLQEVLVHELISHHGLKLALDAADEVAKREIGSTFNSALEEVKRFRSSVPLSEDRPFSLAVEDPNYATMDAVKIDYKDVLSKVGGNEEKAEQIWAQEVIARIAERHARKLSTPPGFLRKIIDALKIFISRLRTNSLLREDKIVRLLTTARNYLNQPLTPVAWENKAAAFSTPVPWGVYMESRSGNPADNQTANSDLYNRVQDAGEEFGSRETLLFGKDWWPQQFNKWKRNLKDIYTEGTGYQEFVHALTKSVRTLTDTAKSSHGMKLLKEALQDKSLYTRQLMTRADLSTRLLNPTGWAAFGSKNNEFVETAGEALISLQYIKEGVPLWEGRLSQKDIDRAIASGALWKGEKEYTIQLPTKAGNTTQTISIPEVNEDFVKSLMNSGLPFGGEDTEAADIKAVAVLNNIARVPTNIVGTDGQVVYRNTPSFKKLNLASYRILKQQYRAKVDLWLEEMKVNHQTNAERILRAIENEVSRGRAASSFSKYVPLLNGVSNYYTSLALQDYAPLLNEEQEETVAEQVKANQVAADEFLDNFLTALETGDVSTLEEFFTKFPEQKEATLKFFKELTDLKENPTDDNLTERRANNIKKLIASNTSLHKELAAKDALSAKAIAANHESIRRFGNHEVRTYLVEVTPEGEEIPVSPKALATNVRSFMPYLRYETRGDAEYVVGQFNENFANYEMDVPIKDSEKNVKHTPDNPAETIRVRMRAEYRYAKIAKSGDADITPMQLLFSLENWGVNLKVEDRKRLIERTTTQNNSIRKRMIYRTLAPGMDRKHRQNMSQTLAELAHRVGNKKFRERIDTIMSPDPKAINAFWNLDWRMLEEKFSILHNNRIDNKAKEIEVQELIQYLHSFGLSIQDVEPMFSEQRETYAKVASGLITAREAKDRVEQIKRKYHKILDNKAKPDVEFYRNEGQKLVEFAEGRNDVLDDTRFADLKTIVAVSHLSGTLAVGVIQLGQLIYASLPYLAYRNERRGYGGGYGMTAATKAIYDAAKIFGSYGFKYTGAAGKDIKGDPKSYLNTRLAEMVNKNIITVDEAENLLNNFDGGLYQAAHFNAVIGASAGRLTGRITGGVKTQQTVKTLMTPFTVIEEFNRHVTGLATYRLAKNKALEVFAKQGFSGDQLEQKAISYANEQARIAVENTQGNYDLFNRQPWARNNFGSLLMMYKMYPTLMIELLKNMPQQGVYFTLGAMMFLSGMSGLPFSKEAKDLLTGLFRLLESKGLLPEGMQSNMHLAQREFANTISDTLETYVGISNTDTFWNYGVVDALFGINFGARVGLSGIVPATGFFPGDYGLKEGVIEAFGPVAGWFQNVERFANASFKYGLTDLRTWKNFPMVGVKNVADAYGYYDDGYAVDSRGYKVADVGLWQSIARILGFTAADVAHSNELVGLIKAQNQYRLRIKRAKMSDLVYFNMQGDRDNYNKTWREIREWDRSAKVGRTGMELNITSDDFKKALTAAKLGLSGRYETSVPKQLRNQYRKLSV